MTAGRLAQLSGVSADTIRYYERRGVLPCAPRSVTGYRQFPQQSLARVGLIRAALSIGFSIDELAEILAERDRGIAPCARVRDLAAEKLATLETLLADLQSWRRRLRDMLVDWDRKLNATPNGQRAGLLESIATKQKDPLRGVSLALFAKKNPKLRNTNEN